MTNPDDVYGPPEVPRDRWSRPLIVPPGGGKPVAYTRCTTFAGSVEDTYNLSLWQQRMVALGLAERPDLLVSVAAHYDDKEELNKICQTALEAAKGKAAAGVGTALHKLTDRLDRGEPLGPVPAEYMPDLDAFAAATKGLKVLALERFVVQDDMKIGGTFDRLYEFEGRRYIGDTKSGSIEYGAGKIAMQLAIYSRSVLYDPKTKERISLGDVDQERAIVVHLPAGQGRCELKWVNIAAGWDAVVNLAAGVRKWRSRKGLIVDFAAFRVPAVAGIGENPDPPLTAVEERADLKSIEQHVTQTRVATTLAVGCLECIDVANNEDPRPWCDCAWDDDESCTGPCRKRAHRPQDCPNPYLRCGQCNAGGHTCPGCGTDVPHDGTVACDACNTETNAVATLAGAFGTVTELTLTQQIDGATSSPALEELWSNNRAAWTDEHTAAAKKRKAQLHQNVLRDAVSAA